MSYLQKFNMQKQEMICTRISKKCSRVSTKKCYFYLFDKHIKTALDEFHFRWLEMEHYRDRDDLSNSYLRSSEPELLYSTIKNESCPSLERINFSKVDIKRIVAEHQRIFAAALSL